MGNELAHFREWDETKQCDWDLLTYPIHDAFHKYFAKLGDIYKKHKHYIVKSMTGIDLSGLMRTMKMKIYLAICEKAMIVLISLF